MSARGRRIRYWIAVCAVLLAVGGASAGIYRWRQVQGAVTFPVAPARQEDFLVIIRCRGELQARRSVQVYTPLVPNLRIAWLAQAGESVKEGEPIVRFDSPIFSRAQP